MIVKDVQYVRILLTKKCNLFCAFCHKEGCAFSESDIDFNLLMETVNTLYGIGYRKIKLMGGEPMLYGRVLEIVKSIRNIGDDIDLSMISNGSASVEKYFELFESGLDRLNISVHGWSNDYFCSNTGGTLVQCEKIKSNIFQLAKAGKINKLNYVLQKDKNEEDFYQLIEGIKDLDVVVDVLNLLTFPGQKDVERFKYSFQEIEELISQHWEIEKTIQYDNQYSLPSKRLILKNGCVINLKVNCLNEQEIFYSCKDCKYKEFCVEGIKAIRLTSDGLIQPCLLRTDNTLNLIGNKNNKYISEYLREL